MTDAMNESSKQRAWTRNDERDRTNYCIRNGNDCCCATCCAVDSLNDIAPNMAEAIIAWGNGRLDDCAPLLKDCYNKLRAIGADNE